MAITTPELNRTERSPLSIVVLSTFERSCSLFVPRSPVTMKCSSFRTAVEIVPAEDAWFPKPSPPSSVPGLAKASGKDRARECLLLKARVPFVAGTAAFIRSDDPDFESGRIAHWHKTVRGPRS